MSLTRRSLVGGGLAALSPLAVMAPALAQHTDPEADRAAVRALHRLLSINQVSRKLERTAVATLVFPKIVKAGFIFGGAYGEGALLQGMTTIGYYNSATASYGLQVGVQWYSYALFFMNQGALNYLNSSKGFEVGVGPSVVVVDEGVARNFTSTTLTQDVYAIVFGQRGLMAGIGIQGSKISKA